MLPTVLSEDSVHFFKYWHNGISEGMRSVNGLYAQYRVYASHYRLQAYEQACHLASQGISTCITCSGEGYRVWVNLQALHLVEDRMNESVEESLQQIA